MVSPRPPTTCEPRSAWLWTTTGHWIPSITVRCSLLVGLLGLSLTIAACDDGRAEPAGSVQLDGEEIGELTLAGLGEDAEPVELAAFRGRPVVVNFFASTCAPCVREMPALETVHQAAGDDVAFVGVAVNDRADAALALAEQTGVTYELAADPSGELFTAAGASLLPTTLVLDGDGAVVRRLTGEITAAELVEVLAEDAGATVVLA